MKIFTPFMNLLLSLLFFSFWSAPVFSEGGKDQNESTLGKVATDARMSTPCGQSRRNTKAELKAIEDEIKKIEKDGTGNI